MSASYEPGNNLQSVDPWETVFLSNRDLSGQVPINFVTRPGIALTPACFADGTYDSNAAQTCLSNLIAAQFRRFVLDIYWDSSNRLFSLCPVGIPSASSNITTASTTSIVPSSTRLNSTSNASRSESAFSKVSDSSSTRNGSSPITRISSSTTALSPTLSSSVPVATATSPTGEILLKLGPYTCSSSLNLAWINELFLNFFVETTGTLEEQVLFMELNLHAAASAADPTGPAPAPDGRELPVPGELVGDQFTDAMSDYLYQPALLQTERANLNASWFDAPQDRYPILEFFSTQTLDNGDLSTPDGWPTENYILISRGMRMLLNWGRIDPQMQDYDFSGDNNTVFSSEDVVTTKNIDSNGAGDLISGCFYQGGITSVGKVNSSWATTSQNQLFPALINNITSCGISPLLNSTLKNTAATNDFLPYNSYARAAVWNWAVGEPQNKSTTGAKDDAHSQFRCALLDLTSAYKGHWRVENCQSRYPVACRLNNQPYLWEISSNQLDYASGPKACPMNSTFDVPRTGLENTYLVHKIMTNSATATTGNGGFDGVWVNLNSLDVTQCWVDAGPSGLCPYYEDPQTLQSRSILVPTIGALIVLILTVLTLFVKCNANHRRNSRTRRRGIGLGAWEYEGVPS